MNFGLTEEQALIESSALALLGKEYDFGQRRLSLDAAYGCRAGIWARFAEVGWLALPLPERAGGLGGGAFETGLLMRAFGRHLVVEPYHSCVLVAGRLLALLGRPEQRDAWLPGLIAGRQRVALAHDEISNPGPWLPRATLAMRRDGGWEISGSKLLAQGVPGAGMILVSASVETADRTMEARVFQVAPGAPGLSVHAAVAADGAHAADVRLERVRVAAADLLGADVDAGPVLESALAWALVVLCWEASGAMTAAYEQTIAYTRQRVQFGQPLAGFQVVAHRLAEMALACEEALAACELAALRLDRGEADACATASMAKSKVTREARFVSQQAVQLHGAMGVSEELPIASYFRKLTAFAQQSGSGAWHSRHFGRAMLDSGAWRASRTLPAADARS